MNRQKSVQNFHLKPFSLENAPEDSQIKVLFSRDETGLQVVFELSAQLNNLAIPEFEASKAQRKENLWEHTCFEAFLAQKGMSNYWEFNLSPSGDWNVYSFTGYRKGMKHEILFKVLPLDVQIPSKSEFNMRTVIDLDLIPLSADLVIGLSAVLENKEGVKSYWAVNHPGETPDFHARGGWLQVKR